MLFEYLSKSLALAQEEFYDEFHGFYFFPNVQAHSAHYTMFVFLRVSHFSIMHSAPVTTLKKWRTFYDDHRAHKIFSKRIQRLRISMNFRKTDEEDKTRIQFQHSLYFYRTDRRIDKHLPFQNSYLYFKILKCLVLNE